jgi:hypothetical protein
LIVIMLIVVILNFNKFYKIDSTDETFLQCRHFEGFSTEAKIKMKPLSYCRADAINPNHGKLS